MRYSYKEFKFWIDEIRAIGTYDIDRDEAYDWIIEETNNEELAMDVISEIYE